jgi:TonB family protein
MVLASLGATFSPALGSEPSPPVAIAPSGTWASDEDPNHPVVIATWGSGMVSISAEGRFSAAGFFDGRSIVAVTRETAADSTVRIGILRARLRDPREIDATFSDDLAGPPHRRETWRYVYVEELPEAIEKVQPRFSGIEGTVLVQVRVGRDGLVKDAKVVKSIPGLDEAALAAVRQWRFKPASSTAGPVEVSVAVPIRFQAR